MRWSAHGCNPPACGMTSRPHAEAIARPLDEREVPLHARIADRRAVGHGELEAREAEFVVLRDIVAGAVDRDGVLRLTAEVPPDGLALRLTDQVPEGDIDRADRH